MGTTNGIAPVILEDMEQIVSDANIKWNDLRDCTVLVTGATGMIGSSLVRALFAANTKYKLNLRILACGRNKEKGTTLAEAYGMEFFCHDICQPFTVAGRVDFIFHCAAITRSTEMVENPTGVIQTMFLGTRNVLELAKDKQIKSMVYLSSMEVYGATSPELPSITEKELGYIDLASPRSCYPESKRMCECLCAGYFSQFRIPVKIARLAQVFGAGTAKDDPRVFAQFARSAASGKDIVLHTEGKSSGNYCEISDAVRGLLVLLLLGKNGEAYNIANTGACMTIREMAELVANVVCGGRISVVLDVPSDIEKRGYAPDATIKLNVDKITKLGWNPRYNLTEMYEWLLADWRSDI